VAAVQAAYQFQITCRWSFSAPWWQVVILELGPVLTALVVGGRVSASLRGARTMKVTEQIDAMELLAIDPMRYLVMRAWWRASSCFRCSPFSPTARHSGRMVVANMAIG